MFRSVSKGYWLALFFVTFGAWINPGLGLLTGLAAPLIIMAIGAPLWHRMALTNWSSETPPDASLGLAYGFTMLVLGICTFGSWFLASFILFLFIGTAAFPLTFMLVVATAPFFFRLSLVLPATALDEKFSFPDARPSARRWGAPCFSPNSC